MTSAIMTETRSEQMERNMRDRRVGVVLSDKVHKTIKVRHEFVYQHPKYGKLLRRKTVLHAHDENNEAKVGDVVEVAACRRISKTKSWRLTRIVRRAT
jgi:small subunit ribosomal protein S17